MLIAQDDDDAHNDDEDVHDDDSQEVWTDLVTVTAPARGVEGGEESPVLGALPGLHLPAHGQQLLSGHGVRNLGH